MEVFKKFNTKIVVWLINIALLITNLNCQILMEINPIQDLMNLIGGADNSNISKKKNRNSNFDNLNIFDTINNNNNIGLPIQVFNLDDIINEKKSGKRRRSNPIKMKEIQIDFTNEGVHKTTKSYDDEGNITIKEEHTNDNSANKDSINPFSQMFDNFFDYNDENTINKKNKKGNLTKNSNKKTSNNIIKEMDGIFEDLLFNFIHSPFDVSNIFNTEPFQVIEIHPYKKNFNKLKDTKTLHTNEDILEENRLKNISKDELELDDLDKPVLNNKITYEKSSNSLDIKNTINLSNKT